MTAGIHVHYRAFLEKLRLTSPEIITAIQDSPCCADLLGSTWTCFLQCWQASVVTHLCHCNALECAAKKKTVCRVL